jgi:CheY-like chemotaxis protein
MDGFEATAAIREAEQRSGRRLPIVALTAHALKGDREMCLAAGMDDYMSKPIRSAELLALIDRIATEAPPAPASTAPFHPTSFDPSDVMATVDGDRALLAELVSLLRADTPRMLSDIRCCTEAGDSDGLRKAAHALRGSVDSFGAHAASEAALALEVMGRDGALTGAGAQIAALERAMQLLEQDLDHLSA